jgi:hypothetical protein
METTLSNEEPRQAGTEEGLRRQACRRSHFCPGLRLALLGHPLLGMVGVVTALVPALANSKGTHRRIYFTRPAETPGAVTCHGTWRIPDLKKP